MIKQVDLTQYVLLADQNYPVPCCYAKPLVQADTHLADIAEFGLRIKHAGGITAKQAAEALAQLGRSFCAAKEFENRMKILCSKTR